MTLTGIGPFWLYQSTSFIFSLTTNEKQADESLMRIYICNYQTLLINRAGKHHKGFYPSSCFRNCSLFIFTHTGPRCLVLSAVLGSICLSLSTYPPTMLQLGNHCSCCFILYWPLDIEMCKSIQWLEHSLLCFINCDFFCIAVCLTKHLQEYRIGSCCSCWKPFGCLAIFTTSSNFLATRPRLAILLTTTTIFGWPRVLCDIWLDVSKKLNLFESECEYVKLYCTQKHTLASAELTAVGGRCSTPAVRAPL